MDQIKKTTMRDVHAWKDADSGLIDDIVYTYLLDLGKNPKNIRFDIVVTYEEEFNY